MTKRELAALKEVRNLLTMNTAGFRDRTVTPDTRFGERESTTVKEVTEGWRECWIYPTIDALIAKYDKDSTK
jgi:hypothetical protein